MRSRIAVIDLGTNTFHLLIAEGRKKGEYGKIFTTIQPVKLGEGGIAQRVITPEAFERGIQAIRDFKQIAVEYRVEKIYAFATAAVRQAGNKQEFLNAIRETTGIDVHLISGEAEAELIYYGVRQAGALNTVPSLIMDIGGGSVELIIANREDILWLASYPCGVALLKEKFHRTDPMDAVQQQRLNAFLDIQLQELYIQASAYDIQTLIGSSGTFETLHDLIYHRNITERATGDSVYNIELAHFVKIHQRLLRSTLQERFMMRGMAAFRAEMIVVASALVQYVLHKLRIRTLKVSTAAMKEGILWCVENPERLSVLLEQSS